MTHIFLCIIEKKKDLEEKQKCMQRKRSFLIDRCALRIELIQVKLEVFAFKEGYFLFPTFTTFYILVHFIRKLSLYKSSAINQCAHITHQQMINFDVISKKLILFGLKMVLFLNLQVSISRMNKKVG